MKPRRVVIMLGTNDTGMSVDEFIKNYTALVQAIQESYPYTDIIVNTVPPVPANHANYPHMDQTKIDDFNMALLSMCEQMGLKFLNSAEALKDANGYGREDYYQTGDIHLKPVGLKAMLSYLRTHAYQTDDRRPDTANIPTRAEYTPEPQLCGDSTQQLGGCRLFRRAGCAVSGQLPGGQDRRHPFQRQRQRQDIPLL